MDLCGRERNGYNWGTECLGLWRSSKKKRGEIWEKYYKEILSLVPRKGREKFAIFSLYGWSFLHSKVWEIPWTLYEIFSQSFFCSRSFFCLLSFFADRPFFINIVTFFQRFLGFFLVHRAFSNFCELFSSKSFFYNRAHMYVELSKAFSSFEGF